MIIAKSSFSFKRAMPFFKNTLYRNRGSLIFYFVLSFIFFPLQYILTALDYTRQLASSPYYSYSPFIGLSGSYTAFSIVFFIAITLITTFVVATNSFSYMHNKRSVDLFHSLPLSRDDLYIASFFSGLAIIWIPIIINFLIITFYSITVPQSNQLLILAELLAWLITTFVIFAITSFATVQLGSTAETSLFAMGLSVSVAAIHFTIFFLSSIFLYGFSEQGFMELCYRLSPISLIIGRQLFNANDTDATIKRHILENNVAFGIWLLIGIALFFAGLALYRQRKSEQAESLGTLGPMQIFMRSVATFIGGVGLSAIYCQVFNIEQSKIIFLILAFIGGLIVYYIGDVILTRSVNSLKKALPAALCTALACTLVMGITIFTGFGFVTRIPAPTSVASVNLPYYSGPYKYTNNVTLTTPEAIEIVTKAHAAQVDSYKNNIEYTNNRSALFNSNYINMEYRLTNGTTMSRAYSNIALSTCEAFVELEANSEFISKTNPIFYTTPTTFEDVKFSNALGSVNLTPSLNSVEKNQLIEALRSDLLNQPISQLNDGARALCYISYYYIVEQSTTNPDKAVHVDENYSKYNGEILVTDSFVNTIAFMHQLGEDYTALLDLDFSEVTYAVATIISDYNETSPAIALTSPNISYIDERYYDFSKYSGQALNGEYDGSKYTPSYYNYTLNPKTITITELNSIKDSLINIFSATKTTPMAQVFVYVDSFIPTGYFYIPMENLPLSIQKNALENGIAAYSPEVLMAWGYDLSIL